MATALAHCNISTIMHSKFEVVPTKITKSYSGQTLNAVKMMIRGK